MTEIPGLPTGDFRQSGIIIHDGFGRDKDCTVYLGIEIGGTKLQLGIGPGDGQLVGLWRGRVAAAEGAEGIRRQILVAVPELLARAGIDRGQLRGAGIGFGGPVDDARRAVIKSHQIAGWDHFPLADWIADLVGLPAVLGNDADVAGLAEASFGAGRGHNPVFYITVGSGIGGGLIIDGKIHRGTGRGAAEIGHLRMPVPGEPDADWVPLELLASGWAIQDFVRRETARRPELQPFWRGVQRAAPELTTEHVAAAASQGDPLALAALSRARNALSEGIAHVIGLVCPQRIVLGGGVSLLAESLWLAPIRERVAQIVFRPFATEYEIVNAALGEAVVVQGALGLAAGGGIG
jgi:glucokinase